MRRPVKYCDLCARTSTRTLRYTRLFIYLYDERKFQILIYLFIFHCHWINLLFFKLHLTFGA